MRIHKHSEGRRATLCTNFVILFIISKLTEINIACALI